VHGAISQVNHRDRKMAMMVNIDAVNSMFMQASAASEDDVETGWCADVQVEHVGAKPTNRVYGVYGVTTWTKRPRFRG